MDQRAFSDHIEKLLFIKRLQARENSFNKFLTGDGILDAGGGLARGGGLGSGGGLDSSGFKNRRPAIQTAMLSNDKNEDDVIEASDNIEELNTVDMIDIKRKVPAKSQKLEEESKEVVKPIAEETRVKAKDKIDGKTKQITLSGVTKSIWGKSEIRRIQNIAEHTIGDYDKFEHDIKDFTGTSSKSVIFEKDGVILKYKSISELSKAVGMNKYKILKGHKPNKSGYSFYHEQLKGTLTFVNRKDLQ
jgi:archaellum component FlaD/FlaE